MNKYSNKKGITLIELIIVIPISIIVLILSFSLYSFTNKVYSRSISESYNQQDVRFVADYIMKELRNAKVISKDPIVVNPQVNYFSLSLVGQQLVKMSYVGEGTTISKIGAKITSLSFLPCDDYGMLRFNVSDTTNGINYNSNFEFMLENSIGTVKIIPLSESSHTIIYYTKY
ncbi:MULTISPECIES: hypothetical protein [Clostridium]|uniref:Prepilin-type N-terminal cleavage/methylation domain-containing protein n=1 Tax=Clostridium frigoriphilum TaxID=443253 RepID=A0ABU7UJG4_9CLOT|nr:hypothetical protein [Clostridium sp. DSM 17811]MBU3098248.1 hypothetical protein [Clostridium sp. DSM 17811]